MDDADDSGLTVVEEPDASRFVLRRGDEVVGHAAYHRRDGTVVVTHVETRIDLRGQGMAAVLMAGVLDQLRATGRTITPVCPYAVDYVRDHPDQADLVT